MLEKKIPYYFVSGGIADFIELVFDNIDPKWVESNMIKIHANKFLIDQDYQVLGLAPPHIHTLIKSGILDSKKEQFRKNVILFGDIPSVSDLIFTAFYFC